MDQDELRAVLSALMATRCGAKRAAAELNKRNIPSRTGRPWTRRMVYVSCRTLGVPNCYYPPEEIARWRRPRTGLSSTSVLMYDNLTIELVG